MASSRIPAEISKYRPGACTEIKLINGHYYVYMYQAIHLQSGKWGKKTGKSIGSIVPGKGFIPNSNYPIYMGEDTKDEITVLEYGQYALLQVIGKDIFEALKKQFPLDKATQIFSYACLLVANGYIHVDQIQSYYEQSWLSYDNRNFTFGMGKTAIGTLLDSLGRRTTRVTNYELAAIAESSSAIAIDGHAVRSCSDENSLGEAGYKFKCLNEDQVNLLMGYDINSRLPLFARMYRGSCNDKSTVEDLDELLNFTGVLFVVDRGFYSVKNLKIFSDNDNFYIIPVPSSTDIFKNAMKDVHYAESFYYRSGNKHARIEYTSMRISDMEYVYVFRDVDENEKSRFNFLHNIELGKSGYTNESFEEHKEHFGVYVLQSNSAMSAEEIFSTYKKRWGIETFYQYLKNRGNFNNLMMQEYCKEQGLSFIMLIAGQIHQKIIAAVKALNDSTLSLQDVMVMARCLKMERRGNIWSLKNARKKDLDILKRIGFEPVMTASA